MRVLSLCFGTLLLFCTHSTVAQDSLPGIEKILNFPSKFIERLTTKSSKIEEQLTQKTEQYLKRLARQEGKIFKKLRKIDSVTATMVFAESQKKYALLIQQVKENSQVNGATSGEYEPYIDSLKGSLSFLVENQALNTSKELQGKVTSSLGKFNLLQGKLQQADYIKQFMRERREQIRQTLSQYTKIPHGLQKEFDNLNKEIYYYTQQIREYRELLNDPDKLTLKTLSLLNKLPAFNAFIKEHAELAGLFAIPGGYGSPQGLSGLQTTDQVQQLLRSQIGSGPNAMSALQQNLQAAQNQLSQFKDKINQLGGGSGDIEMPNFRPSNEKIKTFWKRLEYGTNLQSTRSNYFYPNSTDLGLSVGYKLSGKSIMGVGMSYRIGWGKDISHVVISSEGVGLRSFFDMKLKGSFFASTGFEYNYQQPFNSINRVKNLNSWEQSGLAGITKIISLKIKVFKKTKVQLLWDFLSYQQRPVTQPFKFRVGYNF